jgi:hypothetical protein
MHNDYCAFLFAFSSILLLGRLHLEHHPGFFSEPRYGLRFRSLRFFIAARLAVSDYPVDIGDQAVKLMALCGERLARSLKRITELAIFSTLANHQLTDDLILQALSHNFLF